MRRFLSNVLILIFLPLMLSCSVRRVKREETPHEGSVLFQYLLSYNQEVQNLKGKTLLIYRAGEKTLSFKASVAAMDSGRFLRIDFTDFIFKKPVVSIVRREDEVITIMYTKKLYYRERYADFHFEETTGFNIPKELILKSVLGKVHIFDGRLIKDGSSTILMENDTSSIRIFFNNEPYPIKTVYSFQEDVYTVEFSGFHKFQPGAFPSKIVIKNEESTLDIIYTDVAINDTLDEKIFLIEDSELQDLRPGS